MSVIGIENAFKEDMVNMLEAEGMIRYLGNKRYLRVEQIEDASGNPMWSLNVTMGDEDRVFAETGFEVRAYDRTIGATIVRGE